MRKGPMPLAKEGITVTLPSYLVSILDAHCQRFRMKRSHVVTEALEMYILLKLDTPEVWERLYQDAA